MSSQWEKTPLNATIDLSQFSAVINQKTADSINIIDNTVIKPLENALKIVQKFVSYGYDPISNLIVSTFKIVLDVLKDLNAMGGGMIVVHPYNKKYNKNRVIKLESLTDIFKTYNSVIDSQKAKEAIPITIGEVSLADFPKVDETLIEKIPLTIPALSPSDAVYEIIQSFDNEADTYRPQWRQENIVSAFGILLTTGSVNNFVTSLNTLNSLLNVKDFKDCFDKISKSYEDWYESVEKENKELQEKQETTRDKGENEDEAMKEIIKLCEDIAQYYFSYMSDALKNTENTISSKTFFTTNKIFERDVITYCNDRAIPLNTETALFADIIYSVSFNPANTSFYDKVDSYRQSGSQLTDEEINILSESIIFNPSENIKKKLKKTIYFNKLVNDLKWKKAKESIEQYVSSAVLEELRWFYFDMEDIPGVKTITDVFEFMYDTISSMKDTTSTALQDLIKLFSLKIKQLKKVILEVANIITSLTSLKANLSMYGLRIQSQKGGITKIKQILQSSISSLSEVSSNQLSVLLFTAGAGWSGEKYIEMFESLTKKTKSALDLLKENSNLTFITSPDLSKNKTLSLQNANISVISSNTVFFTYAILDSTKKIIFEKKDVDKTKSAKVNSYIIRMGSYPVGEYTLQIKAYANYQEVVVNNQNFFYEPEVYLFKEFSIKLIENATTVPTSIVTNPIELTFDPPLTGSIIIDGSSVAVDNITSFEQDIYGEGEHSLQINHENGDNEEFIIDNNSFGSFVEVDLTTILSKKKIYINYAKKQHILFNSSWGTFISIQFGSTENLYALPKKIFLIPGIYRIKYYKNNEWLEVIVEVIDIGNTEIVSIC